MEEKKRIFRTLQETNEKEMKDWEAIAHAGTQIQLLTDMRNAGDLSVAEWSYEVNQILDALDEL